MIMMWHVFAAYQNETKAFGLNYVLRFLLEICQLIGIASA